MLLLCGDDAFAFDTNVKQDTGFEVIGSNEEVLCVCACVCVYVGGGCVCTCACV